MTLALLLTLFLSLAIALFTLGLAVWTPTSVLATRIQGLLGRPLVEQKKPDVEGRLEQVLEPISKALPKSPEELSRVRLWLTQAGYREPQHVQMYFGLRGLIVLVALLAVGPSGLLFRSPLWAVLALGLYSGWSIYVISTSGLRWSPFWLVVGALFAMVQVATPRHTGWRGRLLAALLYPELVYSAFLQAAFVRAIASSVRGQAIRWHSKEA